MPNCLINNYLVPITQAQYRHFIHRQTMSSPSYIIIGSGVFEALTSLSLIRKHPNATITLIDRDAFSAPFRVAASWDWNKVVRADYREILVVENS